MSDFTRLVLIFAISIPHMFLYLAYEKWLQDRAEAISTGVVRGVSVSTKHRRMLVLNSWASAVFGWLGAQSVWTIGYLLLARSVDTEEVKLFVYLIAFFSVIGLLNWIYQAGAWYFHLRSELRQAEAD